MKVQLLIFTMFLGIVLAVHLAMKAVVERFGGHVPRTMGDLLLSLKHGRPPAISGRDNLQTLALLEAVYCSAREHRVVAM